MTRQRSQPVRRNSLDGRVVERAERLDVGRLVQAGCRTELGPAVRAGYDAPFPDERYQAGPRAMPLLVPTAPDDPATVANRAAWATLTAAATRPTNRVKARVGS